MPYQQYNFKPQTFDAQKKRPDLRLLYISHSSYDKTWPSVLPSEPAVPKYVLPLMLRPLSTLLQSSPILELSER